MNRFAVVEHFSGSVYTMADFKNLVVVDPYTDERIKYNDKNTLENAWNFVEWCNIEGMSQEALNEWENRMEYTLFS